MLELLKNRVRRLLAQEDGPTTVEYSVMIMLIVLGCVFGARIIGQVTSTSFQETADGINQGLQQHQNNQQN